jgi:hypothetical protein
MGDGWTPDTLLNAFAEARQATLAAFANATIDRIPVDIPIGIAPHGFANSCE